MYTIANQTWLEIDLSAIEHNTKVILDAVKVPALAVVKDDGYGHGAVEVARAFLKAGGSWLAVVRPHEGIALRKAGITAPIIVFGGAIPEEVDACIHYNLTLPLYSFDQIEWLAPRASELGKAVNVHIKLDTAMGRFGVFAEQALALAQAAQQAGGIHIDGIYSHLPFADKGDTLTPKQITRFKAAIEAVEGAGIPLRWKHLCNSGGILNWPEAYFNMVRAGGVLYGIYSKDPDNAISSKMQTAMSWKARLMACKQFPAGWGIGYGQNYITKAGEWIGVIPIGHGDNYHRDPGTRVLIDGKSMPVVGVICMDHLMVSMPQYYPLGTEVIIIGRSGSEEITHQELKKIWKSPASNVCLVHPRVPRVYFNGPASKATTNYRLDQEEPMNDQFSSQPPRSKTAEAWDEVGKQFQALGDSLATAVKNTWKDEANQAQISKVQTRLQTMADDLGDYIKEQTDTPKSQKLSEDVKRVAGSIVDKGEELVQDVRPHLMDALEKLGNALQKLVDTDKPVSQAPATEEPAPEVTREGPEPGEPKDIHD